MSGFSSRVHDAINQAAPVHSTAVTAMRGLSQFVDPSMTGTSRFMQKSGFPFPLLTPQMTTGLATASTAGTRSVVLQGTRLLPWIKAFSTIVSFELLESELVTAVSVDNDGNTLLTIENVLDGPHAAGSPVTINSFIALPVSEVEAGQGGIGEPEVEVDSPFILLPGDLFKVLGVSYHIKTATFVSSGVFGYRYSLKLVEDGGLPALPTGTSFIVAAKAGYLSGVINLPHTDTRGFIRGPVAIDVVSSPMVADYKPTPECDIFIEEFDASGRSLVSARAMQKNDVLSRLNIQRDQFLFWKVAEGGVNWNGTFTELKAYESGRCHIWSPSRPPLDTAPLTEKSTVVASFSPYQVLLNSSITSDVTVFAADTKAEIPSSDYVVDTATGSITFLIAYASAPVVVRYRPRLQWRVSVRPSEPGLEMVVVLGSEVKQVFTLGSAGVLQSLVVSTFDADDIGSIHITFRRASDASGSFTVEMGDWSPNLTTTSAIRYSVTTGSTMDFDWAASGLLVKALWPNLSLVRARLDGESIFSNYLDSGKLLL